MSSGFKPDNFNGLSIDAALRAALDEYDVFDSLIRGKLERHDALDVRQYATHSLTSLITSKAYLIEVQNILKRMDDAARKTERLAQIRVSLSRPASVL